MKKSIFYTMAFLVSVMALACEGKKVGEACETYRSSECGGPGGTCLAVTGSANYCSHTCTAASDCPSGFRCEDVKSTTFSNKGEKKDEKQIKMCVR